MNTEVAKVNQLRGELEIVYGYEIDVLSTSQKLLNNCKSYIAEGSTEVLPLQTLS